VAGTESVPREVIDRRGASGVAAVAGLASAGSPVLVLACDALRRRALVEVAAAPSRFGGGQLALVSHRLSASAVDAQLSALDDAGRGVALADWSMLVQRPGLAAGFEHVIAVDPPPNAGLEPLARRPAGAAQGYYHRAWGDADVALATRVYESEWPSRAVLVAVFRALQALPGDDGFGVADVRQALGGPGPFPRSPEAAGRCMRVLEELALVRLVPESGDRVLRVVSSEATELDRSGAFVAYRARCEESTRYLKELGQAS
jgi:hypothetical protein